MNCEETPRERETAAPQQPSKHLLQLEEHMSGRLKLGTVIEGSPPGVSSHQDASSADNQLCGLGQVTSL